MQNKKVKDKLLKIIKEKNQELLDFNWNEVITIHDVINDYTYFTDKLMEILEEVNT